MLGLSSCFIFKGLEMTPAISHVIYDNDGLLLDTEPFYTKAHEIIAGRFGKTFDWSIKSGMIGLRAEDSAKVLLNALQLPYSVQEYLEARKHLLEEMFPNADPLPGAERLTMHLHHCKVAQAVATSSDRYNFELKITRHREWFRIFECVITGDDPEIRNGKPAPDIFLLAAKRLRASPSGCLVFEDSPAGVEAARAAGMRVIAVPDPNMDDAFYRGADQIVRSLEDVDLSNWGLPPIPTGLM
jgi:pseudouridine-5'-monophosphatase